MGAFEPFKKHYQHDGITLFPSLKAKVENAEIIVLAVGHSQFMNLQSSEVARMTKCRLIFDPIHGWKKEDWVKDGFTHLSLDSVNVL